MMKASFINNLAAAGDGRAPAFAKASAAAKAMADKTAGKPGMCGCACRRRGVVA